MSDNLIKTALIFGVSGQDGSYLARFLLDKHYRVHGTSRDAVRQPFARLHALSIHDRVTTHSVSLNDADAMRRLLLHVRPDEIYNLSGLTSVALSFREPAAAWTSIADGHMMLLELMRETVPAARLFHCASGDCFGDTARGTASDETTSFEPRSPYGQAKAAAHRATGEYRRTFGLHASSGIAFNHESPLRGDAFVTSKIIIGAAAIATGRADRLTLGDLTPSRDWGYAAEYVEAMWLILQQNEPADYVIATGESHTIGEFAAAAFAEFGLDYRDHVDVDSALRRHSDIQYSRGNAALARKILGWEAKTKFKSLVRMLADDARKVAVTASSCGAPPPRRRFSL